MGTSLGIHVQAFKIASKLGLDNTFRISEEALKYIPVALEMYEAAEGVTMSAPDTFMSRIFDKIGREFSLICREHGRFPTEEEMTDKMIYCVNYIFEDICTSQQRESLMRVLNAFKE